MYVSNSYTRSYMRDEPSAHSDFDWVTYINNYPDLQNAGIATREQAIAHWNAHGFAENRTDKSMTEQVAPDDTFDWETYVDNYPDLRDAGISSKVDATRHWNVHGKKEGRTYKPLYDSKMNTESAVGFTLPHPNLSDAIPRVIYQTWGTKELSPGMEAAVQKLKDENIGFHYEIYDDDECRTFIEQNFPLEVLYAYDSLIPGAYKADLWRYCILYLNGGVYLDIKFEPVDGFSLESLMYDDEDCFCINGDSIYNGFMIVKAGNKYLAEAIKRIYLNCMNKCQGNSDSDPTGSGLLTTIIGSNYKSDAHFVEDETITVNNMPVIKAYTTYVRNTDSSFHYTYLWRINRIYNTIDFKNYQINNQ